MEFTAWDRVRIAREMDRPTSLYYIEHIFENFMELHGDRGVKDGHLRSLQDSWRGYHAGSDGFPVYDGKYGNGRGGKNYQGH